MPRFFFVLLCVDRFKIRAKFVLSIKWFQPPLLLLSAARYSGHAQP
jgi:hypothetical protein